MKPRGRTKPISYLKAYAAEIKRTLGFRGAAVVVTQKGKATVALQDMDGYEQTQETRALLKALAQGNRQIEVGKVEPAAEVFARLRTRDPAR